MNNQLAHLQIQLLPQLCSDKVLDEAYCWLRNSRQNSHHNNLYWSFISKDWSVCKARLRHLLRAGEYKISPLQIITLHASTEQAMQVSQWEPLDAIVLKALALVLTPHVTKQIDLSAATHLKHHGGLKYALQQGAKHTQAHLGGYAFKTDIKDYYASINHRTLHDQCCRLIHDRRIQDLLWQVMNRVHVNRGHHRLIEWQSIPRGCPLSPLFAALYLQPLDAFMKKNHCAYVRYMDDFIIFSKTRHGLRRIKKQCYQILDQLGLKLSFEKTWVGRLRVDDSAHKLPAQVNQDGPVNGFTFLGYHFAFKQGVMRLMVANRTWQRMTTRLLRLYEQGATKTRLAVYVKNWLRWAKTGVALNIEQLISTIKIRIKSVGLKMDLLL